jgi:ArsR family transcriptional regulator
MAKINIRYIQNAAQVLRVIGHPVRLRIVEALEGSPKTVKALMKELGLPQVTVSKHLAALKKRRIVKSEAISNFRQYSIAYRNVIHVLNCLRTHGGNVR